METAKLNTKFRKPIGKFSKKNTRKDIDDPFYSEENMRWLEESAKQMENGQVVAMTFDELKALLHG